MKPKHTLFSWLLTCIGGSVLLQLWYTAAGHFISGSAEDYGALLLLIGIMVSLLASIPAFILYHILAGILQRQAKDIVIGKLLLYVYAAIVTWISLRMLFGLIGSGYMSDKELEMVSQSALPYIVMFIVSVWIWFGRKAKNADAPVPAIASSEDEDFPHTQSAIVLVIMSVTICWDLYNMMRYGAYYSRVSYLTSCIFLIAEITGVVLLGLRRRQGWYVLALLAVLFVSGTVLSIGKAALTDQKELNAYASPTRLLIMAVGIFRLCLLLAPAMRRYFRVGKEALGAVVIGGVLLAVAFFLALL